MSGTATKITLRALEGRPLEDNRVREMVEATAAAIAERQGVAVLGIASDASSITVRLQTGRIQAIGFAAELRRLTTNWYAHKFGTEHLWGAVDQHDSGEEWKH